MNHISRTKRAHQESMIKSASNADVGSVEFAGFRAAVGDWSRCLVDEGAREAVRQIGASQVKHASESSPDWEIGQSNALLALDELADSPMFQGYISFVKEAADDLASGQDIFARADVASTSELRATHPDRLEGYRMAADWVLSHGDDLTKLAFEIPARAAAIQLLADGDGTDAIFLAVAGSDDDILEYIKEAGSFQPRKNHMHEPMGALGTGAGGGSPMAFGANDTAALRASKGGPSRKERSRAARAERDAAKRAKPKPVKPTPTPVPQVVHAAPAEVHMRQGSDEQKRRRILKNRAVSENASSFNPSYVPGSSSRKKTPKGGGGGLALGLGLAGVAGAAGLGAYALKRKREREAEAMSGNRKAASLGTFFF